MKKKRLRSHPIKEFIGCKTHLVMKLSAFLLFLGIFSATANVTAFSQKVTIKVENAELREVFRSLREQTGHMITYSEAKIDSKGTKVTANFENIELSDALEIILKNLPYKYSVEGQRVFIIPAPEKVPQLQRQMIVKGKVTDSEGNPMIGVTVFVIGTTRGVATDANGMYILPIAAAENPVLRFSFIGKKNVEIPYEGQTEINITMKDDDSEIDEVVVTGYQTIAREKITGAVNTITAEELEDRYTANILDNLEGRVAGLMVYNGGMQIRGTSSIRVDRTPLLVVDGLPVEGSIEDINPYDIESVTVLKDAAAAAIYGARASNGVLVITTKRARHEGKVDVTVSANFTVYEKQNVDYHDNYYMNPKEQVEVEMANWENFFANDPTAVMMTSMYNSMGAISISPIWHAYYQLATGVITQSELNSRMEEYKNNNFAKEYSNKILKNRFLQQYNIAVRSRTERYSSNLVLNYKRDNSGIINTHDDKFNLFYKGDYNMKRWLSINFAANAIIQKKIESNSEFATNPFNQPAYMRLLNEDGSFNRYSAGYSNIYHTQWEDEPGLLSNHFNHLEEMDYDRTTTKRLGARLQGGLLFRIIDGLTVNTNFIYEINRNDQSSYSEAESYVMRMMRNAYTEKTGETYSYLIPEHGGKLATVNTQNDSWTARGQVNFNRTFGDHTIDFLAGAEFRQTYLKGTRGLMLGYDDQLQSHATLSVDYKNLASSEREIAPLYGMNYPSQQYFYTPFIDSAVGPVKEERHRYGSGYANITYTYKGRYHLFGSYREDAGDIFGLEADLRSKPLWSVGASWNINRENFMAGVSWVDILKLRGSYGVTGNIYHGATSYLTASTGTINSVTGQPISIVESPANPELKWEQTATTNFGVDFALIDNRLRGSLDWYHKKGTDIFSVKLLEDAHGFASMAMNSASLKNNGVEVAIAVDWFRAKQEKGFSWTTSATFAYNKNKITKVDMPATKAYQLITDPLKSGYPVNSIFSLPYAGLSEDGDRFTYWKGRGTEDEEKVTSIWNETPDIALFSGQTDPKVSIGMENRLRYQNIRLSFIMAYYGGHKMRMRQIGETNKDVIGYGPIDKAYLNSWTPQNKDTDVPGFGQYGTSVTSSEYSYADIFVQSAKFLKIRNIVLSYDLPRPLISKIGLEGLSFNLQIDNPRALYIENDLDVDPETGGVRRPTSYVFGININF